MSIKKLVLFCYSTHSSSNPKSIQIEHRNRCTVFVFVFVQGFCVLSKWRVGAWLGGVQQRSPPPPSLFLWCQASSAVPGHWPLHPPGTVYSHSSIFNLMLNHSVNVTLEVLFYFTFSMILTEILILHLLSCLAISKWFHQTNKAWKPTMGQHFSLFRVHWSHNSNTYKIWRGKRQTYLNLYEDGAYIKATWSLNSNQLFKIQLKWQV